MTFSLPSPMWKPSISREKFFENAALVGPVLKMCFKSNGRENKKSEIQSVKKADGI